MRDPPEAVQALGVFVLLLVYDSESEVDLIGLVECLVHAHDLRECFFSMLEAAIAIVQNADAVPQLGLLVLQSVMRNGGIARHEAYLGVS